MRDLTLTERGVQTYWVKSSVGIICHFLLMISAKYCDVSYIDSHVEFFVHFL